VRFLGERDYRHGSEDRIGILLVNLGTPAAPTAKALRPYLRQFLGDPRVIETPRLLWAVILNLIIVPFRSPKSARAYAEVWTEEGSPLMVISRAQREDLARRFRDEPVVVELGMSYGEPSIPGALRRLKEAQCRHLLVLPLYPQYSGCTTGSVFADVAKELRTWRWVPSLSFVGHYFDEPEYIGALAQSISSHWENGSGKPDRLVFSFHGTPVDYLAEGDPYHCQCLKTARLAAERLGLGPDEWMATFQSRFGNKEWLQPYTDKTMERLPGEGVRKIHVVCPAFSADCLETLEEIAGENREIFMGAGGEEFDYIPALNDGEGHMDFIEGLARRGIASWLEKLGRYNAADQRELQSGRPAAASPAMARLVPLGGGPPPDQG